jgi:hypothetical protein
LTKRQTPWEDLGVDALRLAKLTDLDRELRPLRARVTRWEHTLSNLRTQVRLTETILGSLVRAEAELTARRQQIKADTDA